MPVVKAEGAQVLKPFRPPKEFLDIFWILAEGSDEQRTKGTIELSRLIKETENEKEKIVAYCKDRLVKGLSSGRKFARIGFSVTLSELLRRKHLQSNDVLATIHSKLKIQHHEKSSKSELGGIFLGRAFGFSSIVQSNTLSEISGEALSKMTDEIISMASKKSYLKAICIKLLEDIVSQVSSENFEEHVWPKLKDKMKQGWEMCSLDLLSLQLVCRAKFPDVVTKKFLKKHWGHPVLSEENDGKLLKATLDTIQKKEILLERIVPMALADGRDISSLWKGIGEKLVRQEPEKRADVVATRHFLGLKFASKLLEGASKEEVLDLTLSPALACHIFHVNTHKDDPVAKEARVLFERLVSQLKIRETDDEHFILNILEMLWRLDAELKSKLKPAKGGPRIDLINSTNFTQLIDLMTSKETESYAEILIAMIKGKNQWEVLSDHPPSRAHQTDTCLRQLQHLTTISSSHQSTILTLMLRLAYFKVDRKVKSVRHCEACINFEGNDASRKLCESLLFKSLNTISTQNISHQKRAERDSNFIEVLYNLCQYMQELLSTEKVQAIKEWSDELRSEWNKVYETVTQIKKNESSTQITQAFLLLFLYLSLQMLADLKTVSEILQDVFICFEKATAGKKSKKQNPEDPPWIEVLTEVLLQLMSLPSHLGRVVTAMVFRMLTNHMTPKAVGLITEVLIPKKTRGDDAGGAMVEADQENDEDDDDEEEDNMEEDSSSDDDEEDENGEDKEDEDEEDIDDEEEDDIEVDEKFRESVKQALGQAADVGDSDDEEQELSDLSDSEMFKLDDMLAEVFRQRRKAGSGKKARAEKQAELANFRLRVLDLVENMIKSDRCGDFLLEIVKPLLILTLRSNSSESQALSGRAKVLFNQLRTRSKGLKDKIHTEEEQRNFFLELLELAKKTTDPAHLQAVSTAVYIVMNITYEDNDATGVSACAELFQETLTGVISKKQSKPHFTFFTSIIEMNPSLFQSLSSVLLSNLHDESIKVYNKTLCCSVLASLCKKVDNNETEKQIKTQWMGQAASIASQIVFSTTRDNIKSLLLKEVLQLVLSLQARLDCLEQNPFDSSLKQKLTELKSKFNTDLKRLANKVISGIDRSQKQDGGKKKKKKRKLSKSENDVPQSKKAKHKE